MTWVVLVMSGLLEAGWALWVWTGIGAAVTATIGMVWLGEGVSVLKVVSVAGIAGIAGLQLSSGDTAADSLAGARAVTSGE